MLPDHISIAVPPHIDRNAMMDVRIKAGENLSLDVPVSGEPPATKEWRRKGEMVTSDNRVSVIAKDYQTLLKIWECKRSDSGELTLRASNRNGEDTCTVNLTVLDTPSPPEGPLKHSNESRHGCTVSWRPSKDDGGSDIIHYAVEKMDIASFRCVSNVKIYLKNYRKKLLKDLVTII